MRRAFGLRFRAVSIALASIVIPTSAQAGSAMTVSERTADELRVIDILCQDTKAGTDCVIAGTRIINKPTGPIATFVKKGACAVEVGSSHLLFHKTGQVLSNTEGPAGDCATSIVSSIDFAQNTYTQRIFSNNKKGAFCAAQEDQVHRYQRVAFGEEGVSCSALVPSVSLWSP